MPTINNTFDSDEQLSDIASTVSGAESASLTEADYSESGSGPYTYSGAYSATRDGVYAVTLNTAADSSGNDGGSGQQDEMTTVGTIVDTFETGDLSAGWSNTSDYSATQTQPRSGSYAMEYAGTKNSSFGNTQLSISAQAYTQLFFSAYYTAFDNLCQYGLTTGNATDTTGSSWATRYGVDDGTYTGTAGNVFYYDGTGTQVDTGVTLSVNAYYKLITQNVDFTNETYDLVVEDNTGTSVVSQTGIAFESSMSSADYIKLTGSGGSVIHYEDFVTVV